MSTALTSARLGSDRFGSERQHLTRQIWRTEEEVQRELVVGYTLQLQQRVTRWQVLSMTSLSLFILSFQLTGETSLCRIYIVTK